MLPDRGALRMALRVQRLRPGRARGGCRAFASCRRYEGSVANRPCLHGWGRGVTIGQGRGVTIGQGRGVTIGQGRGVTIGQGRGAKVECQAQRIHYLRGRQRPGAGLHRPRGPLTPSSLELRSASLELQALPVVVVSAPGAGRTDGVAPIYGRADRRCSPTRRWGARCASPRPRWRGPTPPAPSTEGSKSRHPCCHPVMRPRWAPTPTHGGRDVPPHTGSSGARPRWQIEPA